MSLRKSHEDDRFVTPLYSVAEASRYLGVPRTTLQQWVRGYEIRPKGRPTVSGAPIVTSVQANSGLTLPFIGLAEAYVLSAFREAKVPLQRIRPALDCLEEEFGISHALGSKSLYTDGAEVIYDYAESHGDTPEARTARDLVVVRKGQRVFKEVVDNYLRRIEFGADGWAKLIQLPQYDNARVVVDPHRSYGAPIFAHGAVRIDDVLSRFKAGEAIDALSEDFGVPQEEILDVLRVHTTAA